MCGTRVYATRRNLVAVLLLKENVPLYVRARGKWLPLNCVLCRIACAAKVNYKHIYSENPSLASAGEVLTMHWEVSDGQV